MNNTISVIVPFYNSEIHIERCVRSLMEQSLKTGIEFIFVNDGSTDASVEIITNICSEYKEREGQVIVLSKNNGGVGSARNAGINTARYDIVCFVDSDDVVSLDYAETIISQFSDNDLLIFSTKRHSSTELLEVTNEYRLTPRSFNDKKASLDYLYNLKYPGYGVDFIGFVWDKAYRRTIIKNNNISFSETITWKEDDIFVLTYLRYINKIRIIPNVLYCYYISEIGLTHSMRQVNKRYEVMTRLFESLTYLPSPIFCQGFAQWIYNYTVRLIKQSKTWHETKEGCSIARDILLSYWDSLGHRPRLPYGLIQSEILGNRALQFYFLMVKTKNVLLH